MASKMAQRVVRAFQVYGMANLRSDETGIDGVVIWVSTGWVAGKRLKHGPRIKVYKGRKATGSTFMASVSCSPKPEVKEGALPSKVFKQVSRFIVKNLDTLKLHWDAEIDSTEATSAIKKLRHGPRVKVTDLKTGALLASVSISDPPVIKVGSLKGRMRKKVFAFIALNQEVLLRHWRSETSSKQALNSLKPVPQKTDSRKIIRK
jgi:hypothetical protein